MSTSESQPLLSQRRRAPRQTTSPPFESPGETRISQTRHATRHFFSSKLGHYSVLGLVSLDVACIFADFLIALHRCEHERCQGPERQDLQTVQNWLGVVSIMFSCLFLAELGASIWAFGGSFFQSRFHIFDAVVIIVGFVFDVCLSGVLEDIASIVIILRLWRVFKIIEEFSAGAEEEMEGLYLQIERLKEENQELRKRVVTAGKSTQDDM